MSDNKLTVNVITYNHEKYLAQCLDSILEQRTNFGFVIRIFDDASTDSTPQICRNYEKKYPGKIHLFLAEKNLGIEKHVFVNALRSYLNVETPYFCFIEGDDYLCDNNKFQKQFDILEAHPECSFCICKSKIHLEEDLSRDFGIYPSISNSIITRDDARNTPELPLLSLIACRMIRTSAICIDENYPEAFVLDIPQTYELLKQGHMYFIDEVMAVYRMQHNGSWRGLPISKQVELLFERILRYNKYSNGEFECNLFWFTARELDSLLVYRKVMNSQNDLDIQNPIDWCRVKRYFIPEFVRDVFHIPRDVFRLIRRFYKGQRWA